MPVCVSTATSRELHAADAVPADVQVAQLRAVALVVFAPIGAMHDLVDVRFPQRLRERHAAIRLATREHAAVLENDLLRLRVQRRRNTRGKIARGEVRGIARRRRDGAGNAAAARGRAGRVSRITDTCVDVLGAQSQLLRHGLSDDRARAGTDVLRAGEGCDRAVAANPHFAGGRAVNDVDPLRLRHADPAFDRPCVRARRLPLRPVRTLGADAALDLACARIVGVVRVDLLAQRERIHAEALRQLIDRLLEREDALAPDPARETRRTDRHR